jgi:hypothetical protein
MFVCVCMLYEGKRRNSIPLLKESIGLIKRANDIKMYFMQNAKKLIITFLQEDFFIYLKNVFLWVDWICTQLLASIRIHAVVC